MNLNVSSPRNLCTNFFPAFCFIFEIFNKKSNWMPWGFFFSKKDFGISLRIWEEKYWEKVYGLIFGETHKENNEVVPQKAA